MTKIDLLILAGAGALAATAGALWFTREPSIALEDAPPVAQQLVAESSDPALRQALAEGRSIRLRALKPSSDVGTFQREVEGRGGTADMSAADMEALQITESDIRRRSRSDAWAPR
ncbi:MAG: hypothetical protein M3Q74_13550 [Pseudomonadota bacterium]|nr:hypothetical protein [Pseudomonadota bacterium]